MLRKRRNDEEKCLNHGKVTRLDEENIFNIT